MQRVIVIDYGMGNLFSVAKKLTQIGASVTVSSSVDDIKSADKIILPGVGHFGKAMRNLEDMKLIDALNQKVLIEKTPVLGICLGMQLMCKSSEEGNCNGLNWIDAEVKRFKVNDSLRYKVPHTGWNQIQIEKESSVMQHLKSEDEFYFVHSYYVSCNDSSDILNSTLFEQRFTSAFQKDNIIGVQYHPEKSYEVGKELIQNFINL